MYIWTVHIVIVITGIIMTILMTLFIKILSYEFYYILI